MSAGSATPTPVGHTGLDITVWSSDDKGPPGRLSRQDRRCCAGRCTSRPSAPPARPPPTTDYTAVRDKRTAGLATLSVARKLARRCYHTLRELGRRRSPRRVSRQLRTAAAPVNR